jgi:hypothetical protein
MHWLVYGEKPSHNIESVKLVLNRLVGETGHDCILGIDNLRPYLSRQHEPITHSVLIIDSIEDIEDLKDFFPRINDWKTIIGIDDLGDPDLFKHVFQFHPSFVSYLPGDLGHLQMVAERMVKKSLAPAC